MAKRLQMNDDREIREVRYIPWRKYLARAAAVIVLTGASYLIYRNYGEDRALADEIISSGNRTQAAEFLRSSQGILNQEQFRALSNITQSP